MLLRQERKAGIANIFSINNSKMIATGPSVV
jgi:hypothetical protein